MSMADLIAPAEPSFVCWKNRVSEAQLGLGNWERACHLSTV